jgi:hypothetical protein
MRNGTSVSQLLMILGVALLATGCDADPAPAGSVTVQLPPPRPYKAAAAKPGFSKPLTGTVS